MKSETIEIADLATILERRAEKGRVIAAVVGAPGSGKSTIAEKLAGKLNAVRPEMAAVLPMDGYHYDDLYLGPAGLLARKGAPHTFDVDGLYHVLRRMRARDEVSVAVPVFDRKIEIARAGARLISAAVPVIIVEGNYLLLQSDPWARLRPLFDVTVMLDVAEGLLRSRLTGRWNRFGLTGAEIQRKLEDNDLPNGRLVRTQSAVADYRIVTV
ncbi:nucleoside/nucleotide kinase family protein [Tabrizicola sp.]|uniref:nucleoside/nucleotide kinase family protein n=1 Tax=Tabrizicola sp. TaxID=2005166 RepID=UPI00286A87B9|nr:nucleoside/nucleotide kinase family protein [Tabrizicola sp.]